MEMMSVCSSSASELQSVSVHVVIQQFHFSLFTFCLSSPCEVLDNGLGMCASESILPVPVCVLTGWERERTKANKQRAAEGSLAAPSPWHALSFVSSSSASQPSFPLPMVGVSSKVQSCLIYCALRCPVQSLAVHTNPAHWLTPCSHQMSLRSKKAASIN